MGRRRTRFAAEAEPSPGARNLVRRASASTGEAPSSRPPSFRRAWHFFGEPSGSVGEGRQLPIFPQPSENLFQAGPFLGPADLEISLSLRQRRWNLVLGVQQIEGVQLKIEELEVAHGAVRRLYHKRRKRQCECPDERNSSPSGGGDGQFQNRAGTAPIRLRGVRPVGLRWGK